MGRTTVLMLNLLGMVFNGEHKAGGRIGGDGLTIEEQALIRRATYAGRGFATPTNGRWAGQRILLVPRDTSAVFEKKPKATLELLLKIVDGARPEDAPHAAGCINALCLSPVAGMQAARSSAQKLDEAPPGLTSTRRELLRDLCVRVINQAKRTGGIGKK